MHNSLIREAYQIISPVVMAKIFGKSAKLVYLWGNENPKQPGCSPNRNPIENMANLLAYLSGNGGHKVAIKILAVFCESINKGMKTP